MPLVIRFTRKSDGSVVLEMHRPDGTSTWQRRHGATAGFFAMHDLTHYAVETTLGFARGFYGLVAEGWDLEDFGTPWPSGPLPAEALPAEVIVGLFDTARAAREPITAAQCNQSAGDYFAQSGQQSPVHVTDGDLDRIRSVLAELVRQWDATVPTGTLELNFPG